MKCPNCQAENHEKDKFRKECGQSLARELICSNCGESRALARKYGDGCGHPLTERAPAPKKARKSSTIQSTSFVEGRHQIKKCLSEAGKKKVYLSHDTLLNRDVAFALIKNGTPEPAIVRR